MDDFYNAVKKELTMVKGDSMSFNFQLMGLNGATPTSLYFTCREKPDSENYYFQRSLGNGVNQVSYDSSTDTATYSVRVLPSETDDLTVGRYYYDLQLGVDGDILTLMKGRLNIDWEVTLRG